MSPSPEHWCAQTHQDSVLVLDIPGLLSRARDFDLDVSLLVSVPAQDSGSAWHKLTVEVDGSRQWSRQVPSHNPGDTDSLDYHLRLRLETGQAVRVRALVACHGVQIRHLQIEAREDLTSQGDAE